MMITRIGKIARLPKPIREELNTRLENGESGNSLVKWLNQLPEVQQVLTEQFDGKPIRPQNLSEWRKGGYIEWIHHQLLREQTRWAAEQSTDLGSEAGPRSISIAEDIANIMSAELSLHVRAMGGITDPQKRFKQFRILCRELSRLRRDDQRAIRTMQRRDEWLSLHPEIERSEIRQGLVPPLPSTPDPEPSVASPPGLGAPASRRPDLEQSITEQIPPPAVANQNAGGASVPARHPQTQLETPNSKPETAAQSETVAPSPPDPEPSAVPPKSRETIEREQADENLRKFVAQRQSQLAANPQPSAPIRPNPGYNFKYFTGRNRRSHHSFGLDG